jgi:predicted DCC family thiol-disulfide oxidoreductase YuxK
MLSAGREGEIMDNQVFYNGSCPVCSTAIGRYRRMAPGAAPVCWHDVQVTPEVLATHGVSVDDVVRRLHVLTPAGQMLVGVPALACIWRELPSPLYRWLARASAWPVASRLADMAYEVVAAVLYPWNKWRTRKQQARTAAPTRGS